MKKFFNLMLALVLMSYQYTVVSGDTLQSIAESYCHSDNKKEVAEFREGIREINYDIIGKGDVKEGMVLTIHRFEEKG